MTESKTTPVWGYNAAGESRIFELKGDEILPQGWFESPARAKVEGTDQAADREHRRRLEMRAASAGVTIEPYWDMTRLEAEVHRAEAVRASEKKVAPKQAKAPEEDKSKARQSAEEAARIPPVDSGGAESTVQAEKIEEAHKTSAQILKGADAKKRAKQDEDAKPKAGRNS